MIDGYSVNDVDSCFRRNDGLGGPLRSAWGGLSFRTVAGDGWGG